MNTLVWLKRDLRLQDHAPLHAARSAGSPVLLLYCFESELLSDPHYSDRHWRFVWESLEDLRRSLGPRACALHVCLGDSREIFTALLQDRQLQRIYSYEETGLAKTFARDRDVAAILQKQGIPWVEFPANGVQRGRRNRKGWNRDWGRQMNRPQDVVDITKLGGDSKDLQRTLEPFYLQDVPKSWQSKDHGFQKGGERSAQKTLKDFLENRVPGYARNISKPLASRESCSRLSPYLAWGNLSIRQVYQALEAAQNRRGPSRALQAFESRLHWHCHFIQKFEMECRMEREDINRGYLAHAKPLHPERVKAWAEGNTGYPLIDASMRCLAATGYINFRSRAMLVSFLTHHLWQDWRLSLIHI